MSATTAAQGGWSEFNPVNWNKSCGSEELRIRNNKVLLETGTLMHQELEYYNKNNYTLPEWVWWPVRKLVNVITPTLDQHLTDIVGVEQPMSNPAGTIAGTADLIGKYQGELSIIDYKTCYRFKDDIDIKKYFLQATLYARMYESMTGEPINQIVIMMVEVNNGARVDYIRKTVDYENKLDEMLVKAGVSY